MLLQSPTTNVPLSCSSRNRSDLFFSIAISCPSGILQNSLGFCVHRKIVPASYGAPKCRPSFVTCSSISQTHCYATVDYEGRSVLNWNAVYRRICSLGGPRSGSVSSVLNLVDSDCRRLSKWELCRIVKELRKSRRYRFALEVYEWMSKRAASYRINTSDTAIQLDLIAKVYGVPSAEQYFLKLSDSLKDRKIYGSLLNVYVHAGMQEKAESLMRKMRNRGYATETLQFNVMMTLYMNLKDHEKIELLVSEMMKKNIPLDTCTYNIWLSSCGYQGSLVKMEQVFEQMKLETDIIPNWTTFSTMATMYIKLGNLGKAEDYLRRAESRITGRDYTPYHYLISLYGSVGNKEEVFRVWNVYKASFANIPNIGFCTMISALLKMDDIDGAEKIYDEWLSLKSKYDPKLWNLLLGWYVQKGLSHKAETFFDQMIEAGGIPNSISWEILSEDHIRNMRIPKAVSCLQNAAMCEHSKSWRPKPRNILSILKTCEREADTASEGALMKVLRQVGCFNDFDYMSRVPILNGGEITSGVTCPEDAADSDSANNGAYNLLEQLNESL